MRWLMIIGILLMCGCGHSPDHPETTPESREGKEILETGKYHKMMRKLPGIMKRWKKRMQKTGRTFEGAAGHEYSTTMWEIAAKGDRDWGRILDDPDIPYHYKVDMLFEIAENRLGKGSAWSPSDTDVLIIPYSKRVDSWKEVNGLLRKALPDSENETRQDK